MYNRKRHEEIRLGNKLFDFRRLAKGFPSELSKEFLLVDLLNSLSELTDDPEDIKSNVSDGFVQATSVGTNRRVRTKNRN